MYHLFIQLWGKNSTCPKCSLHAYLTMSTTHNFGTRVVLAPYTNQLPILITFG